jgi:hypothetical protein
MCGRRINPYVAIGVAAGLAATGYVLHALGWLDQAGHDSQVEAGAVILASILTALSGGGWAWQRGQGRCRAARAKAGRDGK